VLEVDILKIDIDVPFACNGFAAGADFYPTIILQPQEDHSLDREKMIAHFAPGIEIPLHPFFGSMGVAPPESAGRIDSARHGCTRKHGQQGTGCGHHALHSCQCEGSAV